MKNILKKLHKQKIKLLALVVSAIFIIGAVPAVSLATDGSEGSSKDTVIFSDNNLTVKKQATVVDSENFKLNFDIAGSNGQSINPNINILLMIDTTGSMASQVEIKNTEDNSIKYMRKIDVVKSAVKDFCDNLKYTGNVNALPGFNNPNNPNIRISLGGFSCTNYIFGNAVGNNDLDASIKVNYTNSFDKIENAVNVLSDPNGVAGDTNIEAAAYKINDMLRSPVYDNVIDNGRPLDKTYVVFFTDGNPTVRDKTILKDNIFYDLVDNAASVCEKVKNGYSNTIIYGVGLYSTTHEQEIGKKIISAISSDGVGITTIDGYEIIKEFKNISQYIASYKNDCIADNVVLTDIISNEFKLKESDLNKIRNSIIDQLKPKIDAGELDASRITVNLDPNNPKKIIITFGKIKAKSIAFSLDIIPENYYLSGNKVPTNGGPSKNTPATSIKYDNVLDNKKDVEINTTETPLVNINPKEGTVKVNKVVLDAQGNEVKSVLDNSTFSVSLTSLGKSKETYNFNVLANTPKVMNFYLKDDETNLYGIYKYTDTDIFNKMTAKNYITAGKYKVSEICPMNYVFDSIYFSTDGENYTPIGKEKEITIDKDTPNITIEVKNRNVNSRYWWDNNKKENKFIYKFKGGTPEE